MPPFIINHLFNILFKVTNMSFNIQYWPIKIPVIIVCPKITAPWKCSIFFSMYSCLTNAQNGQGGWRAYQKPVDKLYDAPEIKTIGGYSFVP